MTPAVKMAEDAGVDFRLHRYQHDPGAESYGLEAAQRLDLDQIGRASCRERV